MSSPIPTAAVEALNLHVLRRLTYGPRPADVREINASGAANWIERQLNPSAIPDPYVAKMISERFPALDTPVSGVRTEFHDHPGSSDRSTDFAVATISRAAWSERQLFEMMVEFWHNHLHVASPSDQTWDSIAHYDATVIRPLAMGSFRDLLIAATQHPAMTSYLTNDNSTAKSPNENLGRELLELQTVGLAAEYTEAEVASSALILTGVSRSHPGGDAEFHPTSHYVGPVKVLGFSAPNGRAADGLDVVVRYLSYLAAHPLTSVTIAKKLAVRFVSDTPSDRLVGALAATYRANDTRIVPVLRRLFTDPEFLESRGTKIKRPLEDVLSVIRAQGVLAAPSGTEGAHRLWSLARTNGWAPNQWHAPNGFPDVAPAWASPVLALGKWNLRYGFLSGSISKQGFTTPPLTDLVPAPAPTTWGELVDKISRTLLGQVLPAEERLNLLSYVPVAPTDRLPTPNPARWPLAELAALVLSTNTAVTR